MKIQGTLTAWVSLDAEGRVTEVEINAALVGFTADGAFSDDLVDLDDADLPEIETTIQNTETWPSVVVLDDRGVRYAVAP